jgi:hypothetical protein
LNELFDRLDLLLGGEFLVPRSLSRFVDFGGHLFEALDEFFAFGGHAVDVGGGDGLAVYLALELAFFDLAVFEFFFYEMLDGFVGRWTFVDEFIADSDV